MLCLRLLHLFSFGVVVLFDYLGSDVYALIVLLVFMIWALNPFIICLSLLWLRSCIYCFWLLVCLFVVFVCLILGFS